MGDAAAVQELEGRGEVADDLGGLLLGESEQESISKITNFDLRSNDIESENERKLSRSNLTRRWICPRRGPPLAFSNTR